MRARPVLRERRVAARRAGLDLLRATVRVAEAAPEVAGHLEWGGVRTHEARRVRLPRSLAEELGAYLAGRPMGREKLVFTAPLPEDLRLYDLRHTAASLMIREGASIKAVQKQLGHGTASITQDTPTGVCSMTSLWRSPVAWSMPALKRSRSWHGASTDQRLSRSVKAQVSRCGAEPRSLMNRDWMRERLESYQALCEVYLDEFAASGSQGDKLRPIAGQLVLQMRTVQQILKRLDPALAGEVEEPRFQSVINDWRVSRSLAAVQQGLGMVHDIEEWAANLAPDAPSVIADQFHPRVWAAAAALWDTGQYRVAVGQATVSLSAHIARKAGSPLSERELVAHVFSPNQPGPNQRRLHLPGGKASKTWRSRQEGLHLVAQGAFAGIRNVIAHAEGEWSEQVALEHLAVLSVLARWADETEVLNGPEG